MTKLVLLLLLVSSLSFSKGSKSMSNLVSPSHTADAIIAKMKNGYTCDNSDVKSYQESPKVFQALVAKLKVSDVETKAGGIGYFIEIGGPVYESKEDGTIRGSPYIADLTLIQAMVEFLGDKELDVQNAASREILLNVPDLYLRNFSKEVIDVVAANPGIPDAAELLAKTGSERARGLIRSNKLISGQDLFTTRKSLAKLGDSVIEREIIEAYKKEKEPREKRKLAQALGFIASPKSVLTLAQDLRNPMTYPWNQQAPRSFRVHVIEGLHLAYPMEKLLWKSSFSPTTDDYYDSIEKWATDNLGVTWNTPRPPFLYEINVPTPLRKR